MPKNNPNYILKHLNILKSALEDKEVTSKPFTELMDLDETGLWKKCLDLFRVTPIHHNFKEIYKTNPVFNLIFLQTRTEVNFFAMREDLYDLSNNAKKDYSLYKSLRTYFNQCRAKLKN